jgi:hypothetical protein
MAIDSDQAFDLTRRLRGTSLELGNYRFEHWNELTRKQREKLEMLEWNLMLNAMRVQTAAVGLALDEADTSLTQIRKATARAKRAIKTLDTVRKVVAVATALVGLAAAIASKDPAAVAKNAKKVFDVAAEDA